jgi:hypothetical protein
MYGENNQDSSGKMQEKTGKARLTLNDNPEISWYMEIEMHLQWSASH